MNTFKEYPGTKVYGDAAGHEREVSPQFSQYSQEWFYVYSLAGCTDNCPRCNSSEQDDYAGESYWED